MATLITEPASTNPATVDWQNLLSKVTQLGGGYNKACSLTNWESTAEPLIAIGSRFEINGSFYHSTTDESISGWSSIPSGNICYIYATPGSGVATFSYSLTAPTYNAALGGYYNGTARALFSVYKYSDTVYANKRYLDIDNQEITIYAPSSMSINCASYQRNLRVVVTGFGVTLSFTNYLPTGRNLSIQGNTSCVLNGTIGTYSIGAQEIAFSSNGSAWLNNSLKAMAPVFTSQVLLYGATYLLPAGTYMIDGTSNLNGDLKPSLIYLQCYNRASSTWVSITILNGNGVGYKTILSDGVNYRLCNCGDYVHTETALIIKI